MGFLTVVRPETAPQRRFGPSMMLASISTVPFSVRADPRPELNSGSVSNSLTWHTQTHTLLKSNIFLKYYIFAEFKNKKAKEIGMHVEDEL